MNISDFYKNPKIKYACLKLLFFTIITIIAACYYYTLYKSLAQPTAVKSQFICNNSFCKINYLNNKDTVIFTSKINRDDINFLEFRYFDDIVSYSSTETTRSYYIYIYPKSVDFKKHNIYAVGVGDSPMTELGPMKSEKQAKEILKNLNDTIHTKEDISIEIKLKDGITKDYLELFTK